MWCWKAMGICLGPRAGTSEWVWGLGQKQPLVTSAQGPQALSHSVAGTLSPFHGEALGSVKPIWAYSFSTKGQVGGDSIAGPKTCTVSATPPCPLSPLFEVCEELAWAQAGDGDVCQGSGSADDDCAEVPGSMVRRPS